MLPETFFIKMALQRTLVSLVLLASVAVSLAQPGLNLPPSGMSGFARGRVEDVRRVGVMLSPVARAKFREPRASIAVVDREYVITFHQNTPPETVTEMARQLHANEHVQVKVVGNYAHGWKGFAFKVARQSPADTAALLESILITPDVKVGEANQIISKSRPRPRHFVKAPTDTPEAPPADTPKEPEKTEPSEPTTPTEPAPAPKEPLPPCPVLKNTDSTEVKKVASPNWGLQRIDSRDALSKDYEYASAGAGANVFIVDTGVQIDHPEIVGRAFAVGAGGFDAFGGDGLDGHGHGTHCAGTVGGTTTGVAKSATIYSVRVLDEQGSGSIATLVDGLNHVANSNLTNRIASMSLGGGRADALNEAVEAAVKAGVLVIVAAGNEASPACEVSPASAPSAVTVGAHDVKSQMAGFSNYGSCVDIFAPGVGIYSSTIPNTYATWSGTSMATPHVAGVAARLWGKGVCSNNVECAEALRCLGTSGSVTGLDSDSPNLMLYIPPGV